MRISKFTLLAIFAVGVCWGAQGPRHKSLRAYAMGNAHVAVVDDKEALYYNYAGLSQLGKLGNYEKYPEQGYYPGNFFDMRLNIGGAGPLNEVRDVYNLANDLQDLYSDAKSDSKAGGGLVTPERAYIDSLAAHPELTKRINEYDHMLFSMIAKFDAELALHDFGGALWVDGNVAPYIDGGVIIPFIGIDTFYVDAVAQMGGAFNITNDLALGAGIKIAKRQSIDMIRVDASNFSSVNDTLNDRYDNATDDLFEWKNIGVGMDFGMLYQFAREARAGIALNNVFFTKLDGEEIIPDLTVGVDYSPRFFNRNTAYSRKMNFAVDYEDILDDNRNYKPLSHLDFGVELEQVLLAFPGYNDNLRLLKLRLSGGFHGGYPSAGFAVEALRIIQVEVSTWGEERGYYTGQDENRIYMGQVSIGF
ncbi:MAG: hypothetical protein M0P13_10780 [Fibrobacteraceae bacterium]|nr:hypothetical protein [Fibrobacteraceae bacterium]